MKKLLVLLLVLVLAACVIQPDALQPTNTPDTNKQTETILAHHVQAMKDGNLEAVMSDFTDDSTLIFPEGVFHGLAAIRMAFIERLNTATPEELAALRVVRQDVAGEVVYILFENNPSGPVASETYVMRDGKILVETLFAPQ